MTMANPHMIPPRAPMRGSYAPRQMQATGPRQPGGGGAFAAAAQARAGGPKYPDPSWQPKPAGPGNALPAQHAMQQAAEKPGAGGAYAGPIAAQKAQGAQSPGMFAQAASARARGQGAPSSAPMATAPAPAAAQPATSPGVQTSVGVDRGDLGRYAGIRQDMAAFNEAAQARSQQQAALAQQQAAQQAAQKAAGEKATGAVNDAVTGVFESLRDPMTDQPAPGWDWNAEKGGWMPGGALDTPGEATYENYIDVLGGGAEDFLMPEDVKAAKEGAIFTEAAKARRKMSDQLGARGIGASGAAAAQLGGIDQATLQSISDLEAQDWAQAQEQYAQRLATLGDLSTKFTSEENRMAIQKAMQEAEAKGDMWVAAQEIAAAYNADRWAPGAYEAYWDAMSRGIPPEQVAGMFSRVQHGDEFVMEYNGPGEHNTLQSHGNNGEASDAQTETAIENGPSWWGEWATGDAAQRMKQAADAVGIENGTPWQMLSQEERAAVWTWLQQKGWV